MESSALMDRRSFMLGSAAMLTSLGIGLSSCNSDDVSDESEDASDSTTTTLSAVCAYASTQINPIGLNGGSALMVAATHHVFEGLYDLDLHTYDTYNALAADDPVMISDTEYEITLRADAQFSNGDTVMADDVINAFERNMADATSSVFLSFIDSVVAKDDTTITLTLRYPFESLLKSRLSLVKIFPASSTDDELSCVPIGSGPWMYESIDGNDGGVIRFIPNPYYRGSLPAGADAMEWNILVDDEMRTSAFEEGSVQVMENVPETSAEDLMNKSATVEYLPGFNQAFLMFNTKKTPFDDVRVRQAILYAIDVDSLISDQMAGHAAKITSFLPKSHPNYHKASTVYDYDSDRACELLSEAGVKNLNFTLIIDDCWVGKLADQIQDNLADVDITMTSKVQAINWDDYAEPEDGEVLDYDVILASGDPSCFGNDPDLLMSWWYGDNVWMQGRSCWKDSEIWQELQDLMQEAREASDEDTQQKLWNQCFDLLSENVVLYPLFHRELATAYQSTMIDGFEPIATTGLTLLGASPAT